MPISSLTVPSATSRPWFITMHVAADLLDLAEVMARQQHRRALRAEPADQLADLADLAGIEAVRRLVEHEQLRAGRATAGRSRGAASCPASTSSPCG